MTWYELTYVLLDRTPRCHGNQF